VDSNGLTIKIIWSAIENARNRILDGLDDNVQKAMNRLNTEVQNDLDVYWAAITSRIRSVNALKQGINLWSG
jgi:hypothetical protein